MFVRDQKKILTSILLVPAALFFLACCCLQAEAKVSEKSKCGACPKTKSQNDKTNSHDDCPHAKIKAVKDNHAFDLQLAKIYAMPLAVLSMQASGLSLSSSSFIVPQYTAPPLHPSLYFQNPILRV